MVGDGIPGLVCKCKIEDDKIIFCSIHGAAENLFTALEYARRFIGDCPSSGAARSDKGSDRSPVPR
jgi:hypothetical protein